MSSASTLLTDAALVETMKAKQVVVGYFGPENADYEAFLKVSSEYDDITFVHSFDDRLKQILKASTVTLFKSFDEG